MTPLRSALRLCLPLLAILGLAACAADAKFASDSALAQARFVSGEPPSVTLYTVVNNNSEAGAHSGLLIDGRERVLYDPAGTWYHPTVPERADLHYGITDRMLSFYIDYHARVSFRVIEQKRYVPQSTIDLILQRTIAKGAAAKATCSQTLSSILIGVPGFEDIRQTWFPNQMSKDFGKAPGVSYRVIRDGDPDENSGVLTVQANGDPGGI